MISLSTVLWVLVAWVAVSIVVPITFGLLAARASRKREEARRQSIAESMERQRLRAERQRKAFDQIKRWHEPSQPGGGDRAA